MGTFTIPCNRCGDIRSKYEAEGYVVSGCNPDANKPGMCVLEYARPRAIVAGVVSEKMLTTTAKSSKGKKKSKADVTEASQSFAYASARHYVNISALNLRSTPSSSQTNVLRVLTLGQSVEITGPQQDGWWPVRLSDGSEYGFVKANVDDSNGIGTPSLRNPVSSAREVLVAEAARQWERFKYGQGKETIDPFYKYVGEMWAALELPHNGLDDLPWSAACISFIVQQAAIDHPGYRTFRFASSHSKYIHDAIKQAGVASAPFHGVRLYENKPQIGDIVARSRQAPISFEQAASSDTYKSHADIIVAVHADAVYAIGGNVSDSVSVVRYIKTDGGYLSDQKGVFALLVNNVGEDHSLGKD